MRKVSETSKMGDLVGTQLGNYRLVRRLGQGGFADVYLGQQVYLGNVRAIKLLQAPLVHEAAAKFVEEARILARLTHPHIVRLIDFGMEQSTPYLVMDYACGGTLRVRYPRGTRLELSTVVCYVRQVAAALGYAHDKYLIHRDVKPENLLLGEADEILLSDFGISLPGHHSACERPQNMAGTISYMAPEQIQGVPRRASDQYALAAIAYEWLSGYPPFRGSFAEIAAKHCQAEPPPLGKQAPGIPAAVEQVVMQALAKRPEQRHATIRAFAVALEEAAASVWVREPFLRANGPLPSGRHLEDDLEGVPI
jgi:eukaryotic-like serine/threonine-protein kinase